MTPTVTCPSANPATDTGPARADTLASRGVPPCWSSTKTGSVVWLHPPRTVRCRPPAPRPQRINSTTCQDQDKDLQILDVEVEAAAVAATPVVAATLVWEAAAKDSPFLWMDPHYLITCPSIFLRGPHLSIKNDLSLLLCFLIGLFKLSCWFLFNLFFSLSLTQKFIRGTCDEIYFVLCPSNVLSISL